MSDAGSALGGQASTGGGAVSPSFREALNAPPKSGGGSSEFRDALNRDRDTSDKRPRNDRPSDSNDSRSTEHVAGRPETKARDTSPKTDADQRTPRKAERDMRIERSQERDGQEQSRADDALDLDRKVRAKVNGKEKEISLREALDYYQRGESANQRFQEAANLRKEAETAKERAERLLRDPKALVDAIINDETGAKTLHEAYTELQRLAQMSPEQQAEYLRVKELENRAAQMDRLEQERQAQLQQQQADAIIDQHIDGLDDAYEKLGWSPSGKVQDVADMLAASMIDDIKESGTKGVTYRHIAGAVKDAIQDMVSESLSSMDNAALRELIGDKRIKALIAEDVKAVQSRKPAAVPRDQNRQQGGQFAPKKPAGPAVHYAGDMRGFRAMLDEER